MAEDPLTPVQLLKKFIDSDYPETEPRFGAPLRAGDVTYTYQLFASALEDHIKTLGPAAHAHPLTKVLYEGRALLQNFNNLMAACKGSS